MEKKFDFWEGRIIEPIEKGGFVTNSYHVAYPGNFNTLEKSITALDQNHSAGSYKQNDEVLIMRMGINHFILGRLSRPNYDDSDDFRNFQPRICREGDQIISWSRYGYLKSDYLTGSLIYIGNIPKNNAKFIIDANKGYLSSYFFNGFETHNKFGHIKFGDLQLEKNTKVHLGELEISMCTHLNEEKLKERSKEGKLFKNNFFFRVASGGKKGYSEKITDGDLYNIESPIVECFIFSKDEYKKIFKFQVDQETGEVVCEIDNDLTIHNRGEININNDEGNINIESEGSIGIESGGKIDFQASGPGQIEFKSAATGGNGICHLPNCLFTGAPHTGKTI